MNVEPFRTIFDSTFQFIGLLEPDGTLIEANQTALDFGGLTTADVIGKPFWECAWWTISPETQARLQAAIQQASHGEFVRYEVDVLGLAGRVVTIDFSLKPIFDGSGHVTRLIPEGRDITDQKRSEALLSSVLMSSLDGIAALKSVRDAQGTIVDFEWLLVNPQAEALLKCSAEDMIGKRLLETLPGNRDLGLFDAYVRVVETGVPTNHEFYYDHDSIQGWFQNTAVKLGDGFAVTFRDVTEQKEAEEMRLALAAAQMGTWEINLSTQEVIRSHSLDRLFGYVPGGKRRTLDSYTQRIYADDKARFSEALLPYDRQPTNHEVEFRILQPDGGVRWVVARGQVVLDADGHPARLVGVLTDISERKQAEEELRASEARAQRNLAELQAIYATAPVGLCFVDTNLRFVSINQNLAEFNGLPVAATIGRTLREVLPTIADVIEPHYRQAIQTGEPLMDREIHGTLARMPGVERTCLISYYPVKNAQGMVLGVNVVVQDITARKRAEEWLRASEERYRHLADAMPQIIWISDASGAIEYLNQRWMQYTGMTLQQSHTEGTTTAIHPDDRERVRATWQVALQAGIPYEVELRLRRVDGVYRWHLARSIPICDATGAIVNWFGTSTDIHTQKEAEVALQEARDAAEAAKQMQSTFLANMSHEIRTPLTSMIGFASLLARKLDGKSRVQAQRIEEGGKRLLETLNAILMLAKLEAGRVEVELEDLHLAAELQEVVKFYQKQAEEKGLLVAFDVTPRATTARARLDRGALTSIVQNLFSNAIKYTEQGSIIVTVDAHAGAAQHLRANGSGATAGWVSVHVEDTGVGIDPAFLPHIFDAFRQENPDASRSQLGSGLGLSIAKQLAEKMHGTITVESRLGHGSRFTVSFPLAATPANAPIPANSAATAQVPVRYHVLLVEDNPDTQMLITELLESQYALTVVTQAQEALAAAQHILDGAGHPFDAVLMDINLGGGLSGTDVLTALRATRAYQGVPIAALTAYALPGDQERFLQAGFNAYLRKPFTVEELLDLVSRLVAA